MLRTPVRNINSNIVRINHTRFHCVAAQSLALPASPTGCGRARFPRACGARIQIPFCHIKQKRLAKSKSFLFGGEGGILLRTPCCNINSYFVWHSHSCIHCVTATPYCSLFLPLRQRSQTSPSCRYPALGFKSHSAYTNKKTSIK